jgi:hypothetical protein
MARVYPVPAAYRIDLQRHWIPAFAGMTRTIKGSFCTATCHEIDAGAVVVLRRVIACRAD